MHRNGYKIMEMPKITLRAARVNADLTQVQAAKAMGKTKQTIVNWESGASSIKYTDLVKLSELYKIPIENLLIPEHK